MEGGPGTGWVERQCVDYKRCRGQAHVLGAALCVVSNLPACNISSSARQDSFFPFFWGGLPSRTHFPSFFLPQTTTQAKAKKLAAEAKAKAEKTQADAKVLLKKNRK